MRQVRIAAASPPYDGLNAFELERGLEAAINEHRRRIGLPPLKRNPALAAAARHHSQRMRNLGFFSHIDARDGTSVTERVEAINGSPWRVLAENLAAGQWTAEQVLQGWLDSPGHRANLEHRSHSQIGTSVVLGGHLRTYITQLYGNERPSLEPFPFDSRRVAALWLELRRRVASAAAQCMPR